MKTGLGALAAVLLGLGAVASVSSACGDKKGAIMLAVSTDMKAPKDVNAVSITISANGNIIHSTIGRVTPQGDVLLPATLAIAEGDEAKSIRIRVMAFQERKARVLRDVRTSIPKGGRVALLRIPLNFVNDGSAVGAPLPNGVLPDPNPGTGAPVDGGSSGTSGTSSGDTAKAPAGELDFFNAFQTTCPDPVAQTIIDGECKDNTVDPESLPDFDVAAVGDGTNPGSCFDVAKCLAGAQVLGQGGDTGTDAGVDRPDASTAEDASPPPKDGGAGFKDFRPSAIDFNRSDCTLRLNGANAARLNLALVTKDTGECVRDGECYVPIDRGLGGWREENGVVTLPNFLCTLIKNKNLRLAQTVDACAAKEEKNPLCVTPRGDAPGPGGACGELVVGRDVGPIVGGSTTSQVTAQAAIEAEGASVQQADDLGAACRNLASALGASEAQLATAAAVSDPAKRVTSICEITKATLFQAKTKAGGTTQVIATPQQPQVDLQVVAKSTCQSHCAGRDCDLKANPPRCTGGSLFVECKGQCSAEAAASVECVPCAGTCTGSCNGNVCSASCKAGAGSAVVCNGRCDADFTPLFCRNGKLEGGCQVDARCDASCNVLVAAGADAQKPVLVVNMLAPVDAAAAATLKAALLADLPTILALRARSGALAGELGALTSSVSSLSDIKAACIPPVVKAATSASQNVTSTLEAAASVIGAVI